MNPSGDGPPREERRRGGRIQHAETHLVTNVRVRPGHDVSLIDLSAHGALIEGGHRLQPGRSIELQMSLPDRRVSVRGRVVRCAVSQVWADMVWYRGAIAFDSALDWPVLQGERGYALLVSAALAIADERAAASRVDS